ncbi:MAG: SdrD B-like domain-containing protein [Methylococcaceae bacterium]
MLDGGSGIDTLLGGSGDDRYTVDDAGDEVTENADDGIDTVYSGVSYLLGANLENLALFDGLMIDGYGNELANRITGNDQANWLDGLGGADSLIGGFGDDSYRVDNADDLVIEDEYAGYDNVETTVSYTLADNLENLMLTGADALSGTGNALDNTLYGNMGDNALAGLDGTDWIFGGAGDDWVDGGSGGDILQGDEGDDRLDGGDGNDALDGGFGVDTMQGGLGDDVYQVYDYGDVCLEGSDAGYDIVYAQTAYTLGSNIEDLYLSGWQPLYGIGNEIDNKLFGNSSDNLLQGLAGDDLLGGDWGEDSLQGGEGNDRLDGGDGMDFLQGDAGNDRLIGGDGLDFMQGGTGSDWLDGGYGMDFMWGGADDDTYVVDADTDNVGENSDEGQDNVEATISYTLPDYVENLKLLGDFTLEPYVNALDGTGNTLDNNIDGNDGSNIVSGLDGQDTIDGRAGNDWLSGDGGDDNLYGGDDAVYLYNGEGGYEGEEGYYYTELAANADVISGQDGNDSVDGGSGDDQLYGSDGDDVLYGGDDGLGVDIPMLESFVFLTNDDILDGGTGQDVMDGGSGNDALYGGDGEDDLYGGDDGLLNIRNNDFLDGGAGIDTMRGGTGDDTYIVDGTTQLLTVQGFDECHIGSGDDDVGPSLTSTSDLVIENPNEGYDLIYSSVSLTLPDNVEEVDFTGTANIDVVGNADFNIILGNAGNNRLDGGLGDDTMTGNLGDDVYFLDSLGDTIVEQAGEGADTVRSTIESYTLGANLENLDLVGTAITGYGNELNNLIRGNALGNLIDAGDGNDFISGAGGDDTLNGGLGDDSYVFSIGFGTDVAIDGAGSNDEVRMNDDLTVNDITLSRQGDDVVLGLKNSQDQLVLSQWFNPEQRIESLRFCDGTVVDSAAIEQAVNNQAPVAADDAAAVREDASVNVTGNVLANDSDPDSGDSLSVINSGLYTGIYGTWALAGNGDFSYTLNNAMTEVQALAEGQRLSETLAYAIQDNDPVRPLASNAAITVNIEGSNDAPTLELPITDQTGRAGEPVSYKIADHTFADIDQGDVLTLSAQLLNGDPLPAWLSFDAVNGLFSGTPDTAGDVQIQVTATDTGGLSATDVFTLAIAEQKTASVSGFVYLDADNNGVKDALEAGLMGVGITLTGTDSLGNPIAFSATTNADGSYLFDQLGSGVYQLNETQPDYIDGKDSAGSLGGIVSNDQISAITVKAGEHSSNNNFGEQRAASLGDKVWNDSNANGIQDPGEQGIAGVSVKLLTAAGAVQSTATTDSQGNYLFNQLAPGTYALQVTAPNNYRFTGSNQGGNDTLDSDVDPLTGKTQAVTLMAGENNLSYDAGLSIQPPSSTCLTFNFKGNSATDGTDGNIRSYSEDEVSVHASAFSRDKTTGNWNKAWLGSYSGGLGVTDSSEGSGSGNSHTVDNTGRDNYVLFEFSTAVVVDKAYLGYVLNDSDVKVWIGTFNSPFSQHLKLSDSVLSHFGFTELNQTTLSSTRWADLNAQGISGNTLIIAADTTDKSPEDNFKIQQLKVCVPGTQELPPCVFGSGDAPGVGTPGFWKQWTAIWDGDNSNDYLCNNKANFAETDILYTVTDPVSGTSAKGILVGDWNGNGVTDHSERTLFYSPVEAKTMLSASDNSQDCRYLMTKQLLAAWLNVIAGNNADKIATDINNGIEWLQNHTPNEGGSSYGDGNLTINVSAFKIRSSDQGWQVVANPDPAHSGSYCGAAIKNVLDYYNNTGAGFAIDRDSDTIQGDLVTLLGLQTYQQEFHA